MAVCRSLCHCISLKLQLDLKFYYLFTRQASLSHNHQPMRRFALSRGLIESVGQGSTLLLLAAFEPWPKLRRRGLCRGYMRSYGILLKGLLARLYIRSFDHASFGLCPSNAASLERRRLPWISSSGSELPAACCGLSATGGISGLADVSGCFGCRVSSNPLQTYAHYSCA